MSEFYNTTLEENFADLREESLTLITIFNGIIGILWFFWIGWPGTDHLSLISAWIGTGLLLCSVIASSLLKQRYWALATHILVWGFLIATTCAIVTFTSPGFIYLLILPILFASVLLNAGAMLLVASTTCFIALNLGLARYGTPSPTSATSWIARVFNFTLQILSGDIALPVVILVFVTVTSWLSTRNLHTTLTWMWSGYEQARRNEEKARDHQAELARALKALDEATYRWKRANYMITLARDQAEEASRIKQQFAQTISHELRTPLNLIVGFIEVMVESPEYYGSPLPPTYMRDLSIVYRNASHLQDLVNDVLDLARIEAAQMGLIPEKTDVGTLVREVVNTARSLVESRGLELFVETAPDIPKLWIDPTRIRQVLFNLLNNAVRFTKKGSVTVRVVLRDIAESSTKNSTTSATEVPDVLFSVTDTGTGIAAEDVERIFEEFQQADGSTRRQQEGAGLGLAISQKFVQLHGGHIWVESILGKGSTFYFTIPVRRDHLTHLTDEALVVERAIADYQNEAILLAITRSPSAAVLLNRYLHGYRIVVVRDMERAEHAVQQIAPQAIIIDTAGKEFDVHMLKTLALNWQFHQIPFIACPFPGEEPLRQRLNVDGYLVKPISRQSLQDNLNQLETEIESILIVDDDQDFVRLLTRMLNIPAPRYQISSAYSGQEALALLHLRRPSLILLKITLPDIPGIDLLAQIRDIPGGKQIPIVIISDQDETDTTSILEGTMLITKAEGLMPGEEIQWIQKVLDTTTQTQEQSLQRWQRDT